ncbi:unnamed protein product [Lupinus luteus]|uniref:FAR1 domain-containing protein n=1 Tax=Lupinus luteus TaxID=3873 RepID=A0AAV1WZM1_LUPLU
MKDGRGATRQHSVTRVGCKVPMTVKKINPSGKWYITKLVKEHNHELVPPDKPSIALSNQGPRPQPN